jgi:ubiquinone biosynthesis protein UbiJ
MDIIVRKPAEPRRTLLWSQTVKRIFFAALALTMFALASPVSAETPSLDAARTLVAKAHIGRNLPALALLAAQRTVTYAMIASKLGSSGASSAIAEQINALLPKYQPDWDENLAHAYGKSFSAKELSSLAAEGTSSKYMGKVKAQQAAISGDMQARSKPILIALVTEALMATLAKHAL